MSLKSTHNDNDNDQATQPPVQFASQPVKSTNPFM